MELKSYLDMELITINKTPNPQEVIGLALDMCMTKKCEAKHVTSKQAKFLITADHTSPLEHVGMTILAKGISRSLLAQLTRQRTFKFMSSSQHYQDYSEYGVIVHPDYISTEENLRRNSDEINTINDTLSMSLDGYTDLLDIGVPKEEVRQVLPGASEVNLLITADANNMVKFFRQRRCKRNVMEMRIFASKWHEECMKWFSELFKHALPACGLYGKCNQGYMRSPLCQVD